MIVFSKTFVRDTINVSGDNMERIIMHIDVNNAFLSWSAVDLLNKGFGYDIRDSYAVIGGDETTRRGIVLAKSPLAKKMGVQTGETLYSARKKCPALRTFPPNYLWYQEMSKKLFELLGQYTCDIEVFSIDECFLDYGKVRNLHGDPLVFAHKIQKEIKEKLGFTVNIGIANNKLCAKMASDFSKPNKIHTLFENEVKEKMYSLPISDLFGVGKKSSEKLRKIGIQTIGNLAHTSVEHLYPYFKNQSAKLIEMANGIDESEVIATKEENKGISNSTTLAKDVANKVELYQVLESLSNNVALELRRQNKYTYVICVQLKDQYFKSYSHQRKLKNATNLTKEIFETSKILLDEMWTGEPIRLVGIRLDHLTAISMHQVSLFETVEKRDQDVTLEKTLDSLKEKYGHKVIENASLLEGKQVNFKKAKH